MSAIVLSYLQRYLSDQPQVRDPACHTHRVRIIRTTHGTTHMGHAPKMTTCEVPHGTGWKVITIDDALEMNTRATRCVECAMPVRAHRWSVNGMAHFEHLAKNPQCSLSDRRRSGPGAAPVPGKPVLRRPAAAPTPATTRLGPPTRR